MCYTAENTALPREVIMKRLMVYVIIVLVGVVALAVGAGGAWWLGKVKNNQKDFCFLSILNE